MMHGQKNIKFEAKLVEKIATRFKFKNFFPKIFSFMR